MNLNQGLIDITKATPEKVAYCANGFTSTYDELNESINRFAKSLAQMGIRKGDHVALLLGNSPEFIIGLYGAFRVGATVIPINPIYTADEISYILQNGDVKSVVFLDALLPFFEKLHLKMPELESYIVVPSTEGKETTDQELALKMKSFSDLLRETKYSQKFPELDEEDIAVILYTSGTTGKPKGAMLTHRNLYSNAKDSADYLGITSNDKVIATLPMFHVFCLTVALNGPLMNGATILIVPKFSPQDIFSLTKEQKATVFAGVPTMYNFLYQLPDSNPADLESIRLYISGGASMPVALLENFEKKFNALVSEGYGLSEASPVTCFNPVDRPRKAGSIGTSISNVENKVVDAEGKDLPPGEVGELIVKGPNVMKGYYKMPEETKAAFKDGWLYTGDLAKMDEEGYFSIVERKKDMIIVGGYNVYPREVEEVLYTSPDVVEVAVIGVPDPNYGEAVKAFVVTKVDSPVTAEHLIKHCKNYLVGYKVPRSIVFLGELPKNTTGKILRRSLKELLQSS
jgi:long-chain acyl-CoA synthetase